MIPRTGPIRGSLLVSMALALSLCGADCGDDGDSSMGTGNASADLAGQWCIVKTLAAATDDYPAGTQFPLELIFVVDGETAQMSSPGVSGSAPGTYSNGVWSFYYELQIAAGLTSQNLVQVISTSPFKGTEEHRFYNDYGTQVGSEAATLEGWRKTEASCW